MTFIVELLNSIGNLLITVINFFVDTLQALISLVVSIPTYINFITVRIGGFPPFLLPFAMLGIYVTVILFLIRKGN